MFSPLFPSFIFALALRLLSTPSSASARGVLLTPPSRQAVVKELRKEGQIDAATAAAATAAAARRR